MNQVKLSFPERRQINLDSAPTEIRGLKTELAPHFIVNALTKLPGMIQQNADIAVAFTRSLSIVYRDILEMGHKDLVPLVKELDLLNSYVNLLKIHFGESIHIRSEKQMMTNVFIVPVSLQILMENAMKHNYFSQDQPLTIDLSMNEKYIRFSNRIKHKEYSSFSGKRGLKNLEARCLITTGRSIKVIENRGEFTVQVPLVQLPYA